MTSVTVTDTFDASAARVWPMLSDFGGIHKYMRGLEPCQVEGQGIGSERSIPMAGGVVVERLTWLDEEAMSYSYTILSSPLPFDRYVATVKLRPEGERCGIEWTGYFEPAGASQEDAEKLAHGIYSGAIKGYKQALEG
jgi:hypothetical protein